MAKKRAKVTKASCDKLLALARAITPPPVQPGEARRIEPAPKAARVNARPMPTAAEEDDPLLAEMTRQQLDYMAAIGPEIWREMVLDERRLLLAYLVERGNVTRACIRIGRHRDYFYNGSRTVAFKKAIDIAEEVIADTMERAILRRGVDGVKRTVRYRGVPVPILDPRVPQLKDEAGESIFVQHPHDPDIMVPFRGYEVEIDYNETLSLHILKQVKPTKWNKTPEQTLNVKTDPTQTLDNSLRNLIELVGHVDKKPEADPLDTSYRLAENA